MRIVDLSNGVCHEEVAQRIMPKSLSVSKNLCNISKAEVMHWAHGLTEEFLRRLGSDQEKVVASMTLKINDYVFLVQTTSSAS
jgi:hypothetical protein